MSNETNGNGNTKKEITYIPPIDGFDNTTQILTNVGFGRGATTRYGITYPIPTTDEEARARYNCTLTDLVKMGLMKIATSPAYQGVGFDNDGELVLYGHEKMQELADGYKVGVRKSAGERVTLKAAKATADAATAVALQVAEEVGLSEEQVKAMIAKLVAENTPAE